MAETPPLDIETPAPAIDLQVVFRDLVQPQLDAAERLRQATAQAEGSVAWSLGDGPHSPGEMLRQLAELVDHTWNGAGPAIGPRLEEQLFNIHRGLNDPDLGLNRVIAARLTGLQGALSDPATPSTDEMLKRLTALADATTAAPGPVVEALTTAVQNLLASDIPTDAAAYTRAFADLADHFEADGLPLPFGTGPWAQAAQLALRTLGPWLGRAAASAGKAGLPAITALAGSVVGPLVASAAGLYAIDQLMAGDAPRFLDHPLAAAETAFKDFFVQRHQALIDQVGAYDTTDINAAPANASQALLSAIGFGVEAQLLSVFLERLAPGKSLGINQIAAFLADMGAFQPLARVTWSHLVDAAVGRPLDQYYNTRYPTRIPPFGEILSMGRKHEYDYSGTDPQHAADAFRSDMARQGIPELWVDRFWRYMWADPRLYDIIRMADVALPEGPPDDAWVGQVTYYGIDPGDPDWWLKLKFKKAGYDFIDVPILARVARLRTASTHVTRLASQLRDALRDGRVTVEEFTQELTSHGAGRDNIAINIREVELQRANDQVAQLLAIYADQFLKDVLPLDDFTLAVHALVPDPAVAQGHIDVAVQKHYTRVAAAEAKGIEAAVRTVQAQLLAGYRAQYQAGLITADQLLSSLLAAGLSDELARATVLAEQARRLPRFNPDRLSPDQQALVDVHNQLQRAYIAQYQAGLIDEEQLRGALLSIGRSAELAGALLATEWARKIRLLAAKQDAASKQAHARLLAAFRTALINQYRAALIDAAALQEGLIQAGFPQAEAAAITAAEQARRGELGALPAFAAPQGPSAPRV